MYFANHKNMLPTGEMDCHHHRHLLSCCRGHRHPGRGQGHSQEEVSTSAHRDAATQTAIR